jgi:transcriptional regulator with XRE-family HTH domain
MHRRHVAGLEGAQIKRCGLDAASRLAAALRISVGSLVIAFAGGDESKRPLPAGWQQSRKHPRRSDFRPEGPVAFGRSLRVLRNENQLLQREVAHCAETGRDYPGLLERGAIPSPLVATIFRLAHDLHLGRGATTEVAFTASLLARAYALELEVPDASRQRSKRPSYGAAFS